MPMQMSKKEIALRQQFTEKKQQADKALQEGNTDEARALLDEVKQLKNQIELMTEGRSLDVPDLPGGVNFVPEQERNPEGRAGDTGAKEERQKMFTQAFMKSLRGKRLTEEERDLFESEEFRAMSGKNEEDGGILIPEDISRTIKELKREQEQQLEQYVTVEPVATRSGTRMLEKNSDMTPFAVLEEMDEIAETDQPKFTKLSYNITDYAGILPLSNTLLQDTDQAIMSYVARWFVKKSITTRNALILSILDSLKKVQFKGLDNIKKTLNVTLDPAISAGAIIMTNQDGFDYLDQLKDGDGKYLLKDIPTEPTNKMLFGRRVVVISNKVLKTVSGKAPMIIGDLKEAIVLFDRQQQSIASTDVGAGAFETNTTKVRAIEREDVKLWDSEAVVYGQLTLSAE
ncbi:phage major capsid protein [Bacillus siamensis]|uniref:phage major capsid protein n=1 Tax=Bacillus amyloliquefaciens group TaxID=1938374 RepID=UPI001CCA4D59|nr:MULTISPECIES: phage major capsid protein [Bacillus subtilis group]MDL5022670.1 phage major capsid protein [Bacillus velezensis]MEC1264811.1 phage major capsid protein [Bacillus subtilis]MEC3612007.1 phage major capsid protein [Bacillus velezensis]MED5050168.1 phage major capsid protein [Bacillus siamensis]MED5094755.1 phage major capsid protein [Bacillus siamensis]